MTYIVIEGCDFSGKSTLAKKLKESIEQQFKLKVTLVNEPSKHNARCEEIYKESTTNKDLTHDERLQLMIEQRRLVMEDLVIPALNRGEIVISDRNFISTMVYQTDINGNGMHHILESNLTALEDVVTDLIPDVAILTQIEHKTFVERCTSRGGYIDVLEKPLLDEAYFNRHCDKYISAMNYCTTLFKSFSYIAFENNVNALVLNLRSQFKWQFPDEEETEETVVEKVPEPKGVEAWLVPQ